MFICSVTLSVVSKTNIDDTPSTPTNAICFRKEIRAVPCWPSFWPGYDPGTHLLLCLPSAPISPTDFPNENALCSSPHPQVFSVLIPHYLWPVSRCGNLGLGLGVCFRPTSQRQPGGASTGSS